FKFSPARGTFLQKRSGKKPRPVVVPVLQDRIVQRSILDALCRESFIQSFLDRPTSFGGLRGGSVRKAIELACYAIQEGHRYYLRTDIADFFQNIPENVVLSRIKTYTADPAFDDLLERAVNCELSNIQELQENSTLFPTF